MMGTYTSLADLLRDSGSWLNYHLFNNQDPRVQKEMIAENSKKTKKEKPVITEDELTNRKKIMGQIRLEVIRKIGGVTKFADEINASGQYVYNVLGCKAVASKKMIEALKKYGIIFPNFKKAKDGEI